MEQMQLMTTSTTLFRGRFRSVLTIQNTAPEAT